MFLSLRIHRLPCDPCRFVFCMTILFPTNVFQYKPYVIHVFAWLSPHVNICYDFKTEQE